ncbi:MAG: ferrochelatase [Deltaproteobacteria bacterium]|nr:ferrochelatase [Deltaproteobacteria bacterium]
MSEGALLLVNMGGPRSLGHVRPYLRAIFRDPAILPAPALLRAPLAHAIALLRAPAVRRRYERIGGASPLAAWTLRQEAAVRAALREAGSELRVAHAFRYATPAIAETMGRLRALGARRVGLVPLFPHESHAMTGSVVREARRAASRLGIELDVLPAWADRPDVLALWQRRIEETLGEAPAGARVLFVAHGIPRRSVARGDRYPERVRETAARLGAGLPGDVSWSLAFQSKLGPVEWTRPYIEDEIDRLAASAAPLVLVPLSFVADCLETLYDLDLVASERARQGGIARVARVAAFNDHPDFCRALARQALEWIEEARP